MSLEAGKPESVTEIIQQNTAEENANKVAEQAAAAVVQPVDPATIEDPDERELAVARAELAKSNAPDPATEQPKAQGIPTGDLPAPGAEAKPADANPDGNAVDPKAGKPKTHIPVPIGTIKTLKSERDEATRAAAYWKGVADTKGAATATKAEAVQPTLTPDQQLAANRAMRLDLADKLDNGGLTNRQYEEERQKLEDAELAIRQSMTKPATAEPAPSQNGNDLYLEEKTASLEGQFKYTALIDSEAHWDFLEKEAARQLREEGVQFAKGTLPPAQALQLRTRISQLTDVYGPIWTGKPRDAVYGQQPQPGASQVQPTVPAATQPALSKQAQARADKLVMARDEPPNLAAVGQSGAVAGDPSAATVSAMSDDEIAALPQATRDRILGRLSS